MCQRFWERTAFHRSIGDKRDAYIDLVVEEMLPSFTGLARFCDVFCEREAFTVEESHRILSRAKELGYVLKVHADQLSPSGGASLAAELGATSADHLDFASDADLDAMREAGWWQRCCPAVLILAHTLSIGAAVSGPRVACRAGDRLQSRHLVQ